MHHQVYGIICPSWSGVAVGSTVKPTDMHEELKAHFMYNKKPVDCSHAIDLD